MGQRTGGLLFKCLGKTIEKVQYIYKRHKETTRKYKNKSVKQKKYSNQEVVEPNNYNNKCDCV